MQQPARGAKKVKAARLLTKKVAFKVQHPQKRRPARKIEERQVQQPLVQPVVVQQAIMAAPLAGALAGANQLNAIPLYSGDVGAPDVLEWLDTVNMVSTSFNWNDGVTMATVRARLTGKALQFVWNLAEIDRIPNGWADTAAVPAAVGPPAVAAVPMRPGLASLLKDRFRVDRGIAGVADALSKLIQKPAEGVLDFFDRCIRTHGKLNVDTPNKQNPVYQATLERNIYFSYLGGLRQDIKGPIMQRPVLPVDADSLREAAIAVEASLKPARAIQTVASYGETGEEEMQALQARLEELQVESRSVEAVLKSKAGRGAKKFPTRGGLGSTKTFTGREDKDCFYCGKKGHFQADCFTKKNHEKNGTVQTSRGGGRGRGRGRGGRGGQKRWVALTSLVYDEDGKGVTFSEAEAKPCEEPSKQAEN